MPANKIGCSSWLAAMLATLHVSCYLIPPNPCGEIGIICTDHQELGTMDSGYAHRSMQNQGASQQVALYRAPRFFRHPGLSL